MVDYISIENFNEIMPKRPTDSHKGTFGKVLNIAGSQNYIGASYLSSIAPLRVGSGFVTLACPSTIIPIIASKLSEITFIPLNTNSDGAISDVSIELLKAINSYDVISIGCGIGRSSDTKTFIEDIFKVYTESKWVIDADALNIISELNIEHLPQNAVLTPHPKEMSRLLGVDINDINRNRVEYAVKCAKKYKTTVLLKGHNTVVTDGNCVYINKTGSSSMAKAGSGDVLTGIIAGLTAQGMTIFEAAVKGAYLHGLSGELAAVDLSEYCVLATDLIKYLPKAILKVLK